MAYLSATSKAPPGRSSRNGDEEEWGGPRPVDPRVIAARFVAWHAPADADGDDVRVDSSPQ